MKSGKNLLMLLLILTLTAIIGVGGTFAYLNSITETKKNTFSSSKYASILLREEKWDGYSFLNDETSNGQSANPDSTIPQKDLGVNKAMEYIPGETLPKNPQIMNNGDENGVSVYTAIKVEYFMNGQATPVSYETFKAAYLKKTGITFDTNWMKISDTAKGQVFLYNTPVAIGETTTELFQNIPLSMDMELVNGKLPEFEIRVTGYALQSENLAEEAVKAEMLTFTN